MPTTEVPVRKLNKRHTVQVGEEEIKPSLSTSQTTSQRHETV